MRLDNQEESQNVEDRRSMSPGGMAVGGGIGTVVLALIVWFLGGDPMQLFQQQPGQPGMPGQFGGPMQPGGGNGGAAPQDPELTHFVKVVLGDTEVVWGDLFRKNGKEYRQPKLVLFNGAVQSGCGATGAAVGPFYCPEDEKVYLDLSFYQDLKTKFGAPGDFAQAYVIAHEVGHHVQKLLGVSDQVDKARRRASSKAESNHLSVCLELQADFLAGVWAHYAQERFNFLDPGDIESAINCAKQIGDDRLQMQARGTVVPDSFTHGSSAQRMRWFKLGWTTGDMSQGDTFSAKEL
jgi:predicted metalloprotease